MGDGEPGADREVMAAGCARYVVMPTPASDEELAGNRGCLRYHGTMKHRHLNHEGYTLAAIDDIISRGLWQDWADLRRTILTEPDLLEKIIRVCQAYVSDPYAQRHHFWMNYAKTKAGQTAT